MASRLHESINSLGVLLALAVSFFGFYYEHIRTSEAVDASLSGAWVKTNDESKKVESMSVDLLLVNKGDSSVTVSDLWFEFDYGGPTCCIRKPAIKAQDDTPIAPLIVPPMQAPKVTLRFTFQNLPTGGPWVSTAPRLGVRSIGEEPPREALPPPPTINVEKMSIALELTTVGPNYGHQTMKMPMGELGLKDGTWTSYSPAMIANKLRPVRKDPPFFRSLWNSLIN